ncbi:MAG: hypothetical protein HGB19_06170 [Chlorobiales bacterium]|nr:hypothetical protein [Chlorobiales bacterium]
MKKITVLTTTFVMITFLNLTAFGQDQPEQMDEEFHQHDGFYLSMAIGPVFGSITDEVVGYPYEMDVSGTGIEFDFKIGGAIDENLILHATLNGKVLSGPTIEITGYPSVQAPSSVSFNEVMLGGGLTYYVMPANIFFSGSLGIGRFSISNDNNSSAEVTTETGFSMQVKVGKEWWVSDTWALGIAVTYGKTNLTNSSGGIDEKLDSNRFGILFNATFN